MNLNKQLLPETHDSCIVLTDLEPDDLLSLAILFNHVSKSTSTLIIVGEGNVEKISMCRDVVESLGLSNCIVVQGKLSAKVYPAAALRAFRLNLHESEPATAHKQENDQGKGFSAEALLCECVGAATNPLVIALKPFYELFSLSAPTLKKISLALYGSFNFRAMFKQLGKHEVATVINGAFRRVVLYESFFATGDENSISSLNSTIFDVMRKKAALPVSDARFWQGLLKFIGIWNDHIAVSQLETMSKIANEMHADWAKKENRPLDWDTCSVQIDRLVNRSGKALRNIIASKGEQIVLADFGLMTMLVSQPGSLGTVKRCSIQFDAFGYTSPVQDDRDGNVYLITDTLFDAMARAVADAMK